MSTCQNMGDYLFIDVDEPYSLKLFLSTIHEVADHCRKENLNRVLIDLRKMEGSPNVFDRYEVGIEIVKAWGARIKVAVIARPSILNRMTENTAVNRGAKLLATSEMEDALKWLEVENRNDNNGG